MQGLGFRFPFSVSGVGLYSLGLRVQERWGLGEACKVYRARVLPWRYSTAKYFIDV